MIIENLAMMMTMMMMIMMMIMIIIMIIIIDDDDDVIVIISTCAVLSPKCRKLLHSSSLQEGNLKERNLFVFYIFSYFRFFVSIKYFCIFLYCFREGSKKNIHF